MGIKSILLATIAIVLSTSTNAAGLMLDISDDGAGGTRWQLSGSTTALDFLDNNGIWAWDIDNMVNTTFSGNCTGINSGSASLFSTTSGTMSVIDACAVADFNDTNNDLLSARVNDFYTANIGDTISWNGDFTTSIPLSSLNAGTYTTRTVINLTTPSFSDDLTINIGTVPVPAAVWLFGSGLIGLIGFARRKKA